MRTPRFWFQPLSLKSFIFLPLSLLWRSVGFGRRVFAKPYRSKKPVICIGNLVVGGAGKTPTALAIAHILLRQGARPVFVMRGYGGNVQGPLQVDPESHSARDVGDEALLLSCTAPVWIGRDRAAAIRAAEKQATHIILDDGLQNPHITPHLSLLVVDAATGFGNGQVVPAGPLRETFPSAISRVGGVILIGKSDVHQIALRIKKPIWRARIVSDLRDDFPRHEKFLAFAGIARPEKFYATCAEIGIHLVDWKDFPDHYMFSTSDMAQLFKRAEEKDARLLTTEKDYVRLPLDYRTKVIALPVKLAFDDEAGIKKLIASLS